jgi:hypothetical protein
MAADDARNMETMPWRETGLPIKIDRPAPIHRFLAA